MHRPLLVGMQPLVPDGAEIRTHRDRTGARPDRTGPVEGIELVTKLVRRPQVVVVAEGHP